ncbi:MAG: GSU2403 family nucleotidyltransferase fold protein [Pseudomonadales bacterium]|jgi:hypothetical protein
MIELSHNTQNAYLDLLAACQTPAFDGKGISFVRKKIRDQYYVYTSTKVGQAPVQRYLGPDNEATQRLIDREKALWAAGEVDRKARAILVNQLLAGGARALTAQEGKVLKLLERSGVFLCGGVLIGTPAFNLIGTMLGVVWPDSFATSDLDIAVDNRLPVVVDDDKSVDLARVLQDSGMGFVEVGMLNPKHPSTAYKIRGQQYSVELLTPMRGKPDSKPVHIKQFNAAAEPLRFLDYLLDEIQPMVAAFDTGLLVNVPEPARFALHKLVTSQRRPASQTAKSTKDLYQAEQVLKVLADRNVGAIFAALDAAEEMGGKFMKQLEAAVQQLPEELNPLDM